MKEFFETIVMKDKRRGTVCAMITNTVKEKEAPQQRVYDGEAGKVIISYHKSLTDAARFCAVMENQKGDQKQ